MLVELEQVELPPSGTMTGAVGGDTAEIRGVVTFKCWVMKKAPTVATTSAANAARGSLITAARARRSVSQTGGRPRAHADPGHTGRPGWNLRGRRPARGFPASGARQPATPKPARAAREATLRPGRAKWPARFATPHTSRAPRARSP